ncbi:hypothetical protein KSS87_015483 [Heliosperma pusillum]|nr:hypothetical protein KSS87_015483 [Heliosperma pusillum]
MVLQLYAYGYLDKRFLLLILVMLRLWWRDLL